MVEEGSIRLASSDCRRRRSNHFYLKNKTGVIAVIIHKSDLIQGLRLPSVRFLQSCTLLQDLLDSGWPFFRLVARISAHCSAVFRYGPKR